MHTSFVLHPKRRLSLTAIVTTLLALTAVVAIPHSYADTDEKATKIATLSGKHQKQQFLAGERVEVNSATVADDIFAAGQDILFDDVSAKYVIAVGGSLIFKDVTAEDMILAGGQMDLSGNVKDDIVAAVCPVCPFGGRLHLSGDTQIGDDARLVGRDVDVAATIGGDLYAAAQQFTLSGEIAGTARIEAERITFAPGGRIGGDLFYASPTKPEIPEGVVAGQVRQVEMVTPFAGEVPKVSIWHGILAVLGVLLAILLLGAALQMAVPGLISNAAATARAKPWSTLGRGLVLALMVPAAVAFLMATVIGIPIGMVTMAGFVVLVALAFVAIAYCIGLYVRVLFSRQGIPEGSGSRILWTSLGIFILMIVGLIPFVGWVIGTLAMIAGLGAVISQFGPIFRKPDSAATPA